MPPEAVIKSQDAKRSDRVPPGQRLIEYWPVLHYDFFWERDGYHNRGDPWKEERYG